MTVNGKRSKTPVARTSCTPFAGGSSGSGVDVLADVRDPQAEPLFIVLSESRTELHRARRLRADADGSTFWPDRRNSVTWTLGAILACLGFLVALLLNNRLPGQGILRSIVLLPWILPGVVVAILWRFIYDPQLGLINSVFMRLGFNSGVDLLGNPTTAMAAVIGAAIWKGFPFCTVIYLAALQSRS